MLRIVSCSDIHLGHPKINAFYMTEMYKRILFPLIATADVFFIVGDIFHTDLSLAEARSIHSVRFLQELMKECNKYGVIVRIMQGTFSHDRNQLDHLMPLYHTLELTNDFKVVKDLSVETLSNGMRLLYIPDDLPFGSSDLLMDKARSIMAESDMVDVDYALVHGAFDFCGIPEKQQPKITFRVDQFDFVKRLVLAGHIHTPYRKDHVLYHGSLERMAHNEEEEKGLLVIDDPNDGTSPKWKFFVNHESSIFRKFDDSKVPVEDILGLWRERLEVCPTDRISYLRMVHPDVGVRRSVEKLARSYGHVYFDDVAPKEDTKEFCVQKIDDGQRTDFYVPTKETFSRDLLAYVQRKDPSSTLSEEAIVSYLQK